jgi:hypothetical protein
MKILYNATPNSQVIPISTGGGNQFVLVWFEDDGDWFVYFADISTSQTFIHRIVNKFAINANDLFSLLNMETISDQQYDVYEKWINANFNYQALHKDEKVDEHKICLN